MLVLLRDFLTSNDFTAFLNVIQLGGVLGIGATLWQMGRDREPIAIWVQSDDGRTKLIGTIPRRVLTRAEVTGWISMKAGRPRLDFTRFEPNYSFPDDKVVVPMTAADFELLEKPPHRPKRAPSKGRSFVRLTPSGGSRPRRIPRATRPCLQ
ncbi:hypothetical protein Rvan_1881 [Rhodomicrobium vannielii ATCC 17100]|uniref:Uncharacterized protein n=1 Tax=Rhodomicrobium vannielii (strain ATCC 17100 / DSM 162 / LMG 4299 / NCIMB 10020 / ATH 3.1.1) TaxID=648757 RepID=E3I085_RHOVT|nr:hypothetical protein [Rhodomicrobium vannielii]ADP71120.1 hypothetical protein Rvan_1881 [Rhodomicrobium vannielii ATCC 17100]